MNSTVKAERLARTTPGTAPVQEKKFFERTKIFIVKYRFYHLLVLPGIIWYFIFHYLPMIGLVIAFRDYNGMGGFLGMFRAPWVGFQFFGYLFRSHYFWRLLRNTLIISGLKLLFFFPAPIVLALLLNEIRQNTFKKIVQTISYLPHFLSWVVVSGLVMMMLETAGPVNAMLGWGGVEPISFLSSTKYFRAVLVVSTIWKSVGWGSIIYLAAITNVPMEQYEAAFLEGASRFQRIWYVTLPSIRFVIFIFLILQVGRIIEEDFEQIFNLYNAAVYEVADVFETYVYRRGILQADFSYATAVGLFKSFTSLVLVLAANKSAKMLGQEGLW